MGLEKRKSPRKKGRKVIKRGPPQNFWEMELHAGADAPIQIHPHVAGVTPMYRITFRGYRSRWAAAPQGITPRQFVRAQTGLDMAAVQSASRIFVEYAFSVEFRVRPQRRAIDGPRHVLIAGAWHVTPHVRPVVDAFVLRHAERYGYVAPMSTAVWDGELAGGVHRVVPLEGCSYCPCDTNIFSVGKVNTCLDMYGTCPRAPLALLEEIMVRGRTPTPPSAPALTDPPSEFDPPHVERLRLLYAAALCMKRAPLATGLASTTSEFRGMVADALASRKPNWK